MTGNTSNHRRPLRIACRIITFLISLYLFTVELNSQSTNIMMLIPTNNTIPSTSNTTSSFSDTLNNYLTLTQPSPTFTLAHYDPYLLGGFRNQHMRFVAFVHKAVQHNITQILLPSIRWGDVSKKGRSVGHDVLFDVLYWNQRAEEFGLPRLVRYEKDVLERNNHHDEEVIPCFNVSSSMYSGLNEKKWRSSGIILRQHSIWDYLGEPSIFAHCKYTLDAMHSRKNSNNNTKNDDGPMTYLVPHGGTKMGGRLWWEYDAMQSHRSKPQNDTGKYPDHLPLEQAIYKLLIPSWPIRRAIQESLDEAMIGTSSSSSSSLTTINKPVVVALHPRIEHDMLLHEICSKFMPLNLTKIFDESIRTMPKFDLLFIAVSKALVHGKPPELMKQNPRLLQIALENMVTLDQARKYGVFGTKERRGIPMLESGMSTAGKIKFPVMEASNTDGSKVVTAQSLGVTELVASVVNFFTVLQADAFVGVRGSSFSQDVMSVRYYQHLDRGGSGDGGGENNFVVGPGGMRQLFGPAEPLPCK